MARRSDHSREELYDLIIDAARELARAEGLRGITARRIAAGIGYSVGTLYNHFADLDDIVAHLNGTTLDALHRAFADVPRDGKPEVTLGALARRYIAFVVDNTNLWSVVLEHRFPGAPETPEWLHAKVVRLLEVAERALAPLYAPGREAERLHSARVLWSGLYGICALGIGGKLDASESMTSVADTLIEHYLAGLRAANAAT